MDNYSIKQFEDKGLAHFSYAVWANKKMVLVDPGRDPQPYLRLAKELNTNIRFKSLHFQGGRKLAMGQFRKLNPHKTSNHEKNN